MKNDREDRKRKYTRYKACDTQSKQVASRNEKGRKQSTSA